MSIIARIVLTAVMLLVPVWAVQSATLSVPSGPVVLTVTGAIGATNAPGRADFDMDMLRSLGEVSFSTTTPWTEGVQNFTGVPLKTLVEALGVGEGTLRAEAINDYAIDIPLSDAVDGGPIVAYLHNGQPMSVRQKGPLWIVYPYDLRGEYQAEVIFSRSVWQLNRLEITSDPGR